MGRNWGFGGGGGLASALHAGMALGGAVRSGLDQMALGDEIKNASTEEVANFDREIDKPDSSQYTYDQESGKYLPSLASQQDRESKGLGMSQEIRAPNYEMKRQDKYFASPDDKRTAVAQATYDFWAKKGDTEKADAALERMEGLSLRQQQKELNKLQIEDRKREARNKEIAEAAADFEMGDGSVEDDVEWGSKFRAMFKRVGGKDLTENFTTRMQDGQRVLGIYDRTTGEETGVVPMPMTKEGRVDRAKLMDMALQRYAPEVWKMRQTERHQLAQEKRWDDQTAFNNTKLEEQLKLEREKLNWMKSKGSGGLGGAAESLMQERAAAQRDYVDAVKSGDKERVRQAGAVLAAYNKTFTGATASNRLDVQTMLRLDDMVSKDAEKNNWSPAQREDYAARVYARYGFAPSGDALGGAQPGGIGGVVPPPSAARGKTPEATPAAEPATPARTGTPLGRPDIAAAQAKAAQVNDQREIKDVQTRQRVYQEQLRRFGGDEVRARQAYDEWEKRFSPRK